MTKNKLIDSIKGRLSFKKSLPILIGTVLFGTGYEISSNVHITPTGIIYERVYPEILEKSLIFPDGAQYDFEVLKEEYIQSRKVQRPFFHNHPHDYISKGEVSTISDYLWIMSQSPEEYVAHCLNFVSHNIAYCSDNRLDYPKFPLETIIDGCGDSEDLSILIASLLTQQNINTGIAISQDRTAVAISLGSYEEKDDYPELRKIAELLDDNPKIDTVHYFDRFNIDKYSIITIPDHIPPEHVCWLWTQKIKQNELYYSIIDQIFEYEKSGKRIESKSGPDYLTYNERSRLSFIAAQELSNKRRKDNPEKYQEWISEIKSNGWFDLGFVALNFNEINQLFKPIKLKYLFIEPVPDNRYILKDRLPIDMTFYPCINDLIENENESPVPQPLN